MANLRADGGLSTRRACSKDFGSSTYLPYLHCNEISYPQICVCNLKCYAECLMCLPLLATGTKATLYLR